MRQPHVFSQGCIPSARGLPIGILALAAAYAFGWQASAETDKPHSPDTMRAEVESLGEQDVAWRQIQWKTCLLEGLRESRQQDKPLMLWIFIDMTSSKSRSPTGTSTSPERDDPTTRRALAKPASIHLPPRRRLTCRPGGDQTRRLLPAMASAATTRHAGRRARRTTR